MKSRKVLFAEALKEKTNSVVIHFQYVCAYYQYAFEFMCECVVVGCEPSEEDRKRTENIFRQTCV